MGPDTSNAAAAGGDAAAATGQVAVHPPLAAQPLAAGENGGQDLVGEQVRKKFGRKFYKGTVSAYDSENGWYKVEYEDGDTEDFTLEELQPVLMTQDAETASPEDRKRKKPAKEGEKETPLKKQKKKTPSKATSETPSKTRQRGAAGAHGGKVPPKEKQAAMNGVEKEKKAPVSVSGGKPTRGKTSAPVCKRGQKDKGPAAETPAQQALAMEEEQEEQAWAVEVKDDAAGNGNGKRLIGVRMKKLFQGYGEFIGKVVDYEDVDGQFLYKVQYSDGDEEHLSWFELKPLITSAGTPAKKGRPRQSAGEGSPAKSASTRKSPSQLASPGVLSGVQKESAKEHGKRASPTGKGGRGITKKAASATPPMSTAGVKRGRSTRPSSSAGS